MTCAWKELLSVLPLWMRKEVELLKNNSLQEIRLRINSPPELIFQEKRHTLNRAITGEELRYTFNTACQYSPWAAASAAKGYVTIAGGHRVGLCGEAVLQQGRVTGFRDLSSLCIRIARDFPGIASGISKGCGSVLILGPPGWGKTTLLRDLIRQLEIRETICVVDERRELFPPGQSAGKRVDILSGCSKGEGISMLLRTMGPTCIAVDEITEAEDVSALLQTANCGVRLLATAHAMSVSDLKLRKVYRPLWENNIFDTFLVLNKDKSYRMERMTEWVTSGSAPY